MGELDEYFIVLSEVIFVDDPMKFGRIKCNIPGIIDESTSVIEAMPWVRPFKMHGYQTFCKPVVNQKVWVLVSKTNYNEYWWFPYHETSDMVQQYLDDNYDNQPDVFNAREGSNGNAMFTYDEKNGYLMKIGDDHINIKPNQDIELLAGSHVVKIKDGKVCCGSNGSSGDFKPCVMNDKCLQLREKLSGYFNALSSAASLKPFTDPLAPIFSQISKDITQDIKSENFYCN